MADRLRIGLVGYGRWGQKLLNALHTLPGAALCAVCDSRLSERDDRPTGVPASARIFSSAQQMFQAGALDAVVIATPSGTHAELALLALSHDLHVFVEKPLALDVEGAARVVRAARERRRTLMVGHILHHDAAVSIAYGLLHAGAIGPVRLLLAERSNAKRGDASAAWWELAPHDIAVCARVFGEEPEWVEATAEFSVARATLGYADGVARLQVGYNSARVRRMAWLGDEGALLLQEDGQGAQLRQARLSNQQCAFGSEHGLQRSQSELWSLVDHSMTTSTRIEIPSADALRGELSHFVFCAISGQQPISDGAEGLAVVRVLSAGDRARVSGRRSKLVQLRDAASAFASERAYERDA
jgi:UDP-2-acetamido-3-amino-2,3-dideoxy-glucuronate N-acetyltransferase